MSALSIPHVASGKVRDIYELDDKHLLFVTSDRMSAFDVVMAEPIPDKGRVLTASHCVLAGAAVWRGPQPSGQSRRSRGGAVGDDRDLEGRVMVVRRAEMLPIECIVRGYLSGSAWAEYKRTQTMHGTAAAIRAEAVGAAARAGLHSVNEGRRPGTTRTYPSTPPQPWPARTWRPRPVG